MPHCQPEPDFLLLPREYLAADSDLQGSRPACYSISLHLKLIANGPSLLWKYVWAGKVHWHAAYSQDPFSRNKKAHWLILFYMKWFPTMLLHKRERKLDFMYHIQLLMHPTPLCASVTWELPLIKKWLRHPVGLNSAQPAPLITFQYKRCIVQVTGSWKTPEYLF